MERRFEHTAIDKALDVLFHLGASASPLGVSELGRALSLPRSSAHRLLATLKRRALVEQDGAGKYRAGLGLLALAGGVLDRDPLVAAGRPVIEHAASGLGETFFLVGARGGALRVLDKAEGTGVLRASPKIGSSVPVHATAVGKLYLQLAPEQLPSNSKWKRFTPRTQLDRAALRQEARKAAARGYATNHEEWIAGVSVIASPVQLGTRLAGAVCVALPSVRLAQLSERTIARHAIAAARTIAQRMQGEPAQRLEQSGASG